MGLREEIRAELTAPGGPFELVEAEVLGEKMPVFTNRLRSLREVVARARDFGDREFLVLEDQRVTFTQFERQVASTARWLADNGVTHGDRVAILAANCPEWVVTCFATVSLGGIVAAFNGWWTTHEITAAIDHTEPQLLVGDRRRLERLDGVDHGVPTVIIEEDFDAIRNHAPDASLPDVDLAEDDPCLILFTSGTTGRSKGAVVSHRGLIGFVQTSFANGAERRLLAERRGDPPPPPPPAQSVTLGTSPLFHVSGFHGQVMINLFTGGTIVYRPGRFDPEAVLELIEREGITSFTFLGDMGSRVIAHPQFAEYDTSSIVNIGFGGAPASPALQQRAREAFPQAAHSVGMGYGSSESTAVLTSIGGLDYLQRPESCGQTITGTEVEIRGPDDQPLPPGTEGEIFVRSPYNMLEYWNDPAATANTLLPGRWLAMGDIGKWDDDGFLYINSRARDMILRNAENVYPIEIEYRLEEHPDVAEAAVVGIDHPDWGQEVSAVVVAREGSSPTADELRAWCGDTLAPYKVPTTWQIRSSPLPRNAAGKVVKKEL